MEGFRNSRLIQRITVVPILNNLNHKEMKRVKLAQTFMPETQNCSFESGTKDVLKIEKCRFCMTECSMIWSVCVCSTFNGLNFKSVSFRVDHKSLNLEHSSQQPVYVEIFLNRTVLHLPAISKLIETMLTGFCYRNANCSELWEFSLLSLVHTNTIN